MDPNEFLGLISYATSRDEDQVRLGTLGAVADPATKATVIFDGEDQATSKEYFFATSDGLKANDRVMLVRAGHSWLIMGKVPSTSGFTNGPLTVEGDLDFQNNALIAANVGDTNIDHVWHDDTDNKWHFVSDGSYKQVGNSWVRAGNFEVPYGGSFANEGDLAGVQLRRDGSRDFVRIYANDDIDFTNNTDDQTWARIDPAGLRIFGGDVTLDGGNQFRSLGHLYVGSTSGSGQLILKAGNTEWWGIGTGGDLYSRDGNGDDPRMTINTSTRGHTFHGDTDTGTTRRAAGSGGMNLTADGGAVMLATTGTVAPSSDNTVYLGTSGLRWEHLYVADGQVRTSDLSQKEDVQPSDLGLDFVRRLSPIKYRRKDGGNRPRYGLGADNVRAVLDDMGVDDFGGYVDPSIVDPAKAVNPWAADTLTENNRKSLRTKAVGILELRGEIDEEEVQDLMEEIRQTREVGWAEDFERDRNGPKGLRYDEFIAPMIKAIQELSDRVDNLSATTPRA